MANIDWMQWLQNQPPQAPAMGMAGLGGQPPMPGVGPQQPQPGTMGPGPGSMAPQPPLQPVGQMQPGAIPPMQRPSSGPAAAGAQPRPPGGPGADQRMMAAHYASLEGLNPRVDALTKQQAMAAELRKGGAMPGMRQAGGVTQAANPLEFLGALGSTGLGEYVGSKADTEAKGLGDERKQIFDALRRKLEGQDASGLPPVN